MGALVVIIVLSLGLAVTMWVMGGRIESGQSQPNMGHHSRESTTPESWAAMCVAVAEAMRWAARTYAIAIPITLLVASWSGSASTGATFGAGFVAIAAAPLVLGVIRASQLLVPNGTITR